MHIQPSGGVEGRGVGGQLLCSSNHNNQPQPYMVLIEAEMLCDLFACSLGLTSRMADRQ